MPAFCGAAIPPVRPGCRDFMRNFREMEVCPDNMLPYILTGVIVFIVALVIGIPLGILYRKKVAEKEILSAEEEAKRIINEAIKSAESKKREALVEAKEKILAAKNQLRERSQGAPLRTAGAGTPAPAEGRDPGAQAGKRGAEGGVLRRPPGQPGGGPGPRSPSSRPSRWRLLERISGYTAEEAKAYLIAKLETEVTHEAAMKIKEVEARFKEEADAKAKEIVGLAIQRCAADHVAEATVSVVPLPNDEMKGRIIGREGRNIRTLETLTGVDLIIDDTPEAITVSCFDPVRREIARLALEKLILDGRIHPARIEEMVEKRQAGGGRHHQGRGRARRAGDQRPWACTPSWSSCIGRMKYRTSYGQNVLQPLHRSGPAGRPAGRRDWGGCGRPPSGPACSTTWARPWTTRWRAPTSPSAWSWPGSTRRAKSVVHAIHAHHNDVEPQTVIACLVQAADAISAARPGARRENLENYIKRLEKLEEVTSSFRGVEKSYAIQAGREVRIIVKPEVVSEDEMILAGPGDRPAD